MPYNHDPDMVECRECETEFDLARQNYYDNICPKCLKEEEPERTWDRCVRCDDPIPPTEKTTITVRGAARDPATVSLPVHKRCKRPEDERPRW